MRDMDIFHTVSGQRDPTAGAALSKIIAEERRKARHLRRREQRRRNKRSRQQAVMAKPENSTNFDNPKTTEDQNESV